MIEEEEDMPQEIIYDEEIEELTEEDPELEQNYEETGFVESEEEPEEEPDVSV